MPPWPSRNPSPSVDPTDGILAPVSRPFRKLVAVLMSAAILFAGSGLSGTFAAGIEHGLGIESSAVSPPSETGDSAKKCDHGCAGHFTAHLVTLTDAQALFVPAATTATTSTTPPFGVIPLRRDSFFRPPRSSLA